jgi:hypothetical protein
VVPCLQLRHRFHLLRLFRRDRLRQSEY